MISGSGLELSGGKFSPTDLAKGVGKAANFAIPLAQMFGVEGADQAATINDAIQGQGFGKGTQRKMLAAAKKGARVAEKLIDEFGDEKTQRKKNSAKKVGLQIRERRIHTTSNILLLAGVVRVAAAWQSVVSQVCADLSERIFDRSKYSGLQTMYRIATGATIGPIT